MKLDKPIYKVIMALMLVCLAGGIILCVVGVGKDVGNLGGQICNLFNIIALVFAGFYLLAGYRKDAAKCYQVFGALFALSQLLSIAAVSKNGDYWTTLLSALALTMILVLFLSKDLGRTKSLTFCGIMLVCFIVLFILLAVQGGGSGAYCRLSVQVILSLLYGVMTVAKYLDKVERGRAV